MTYEMTLRETLEDGREEGRAEGKAEGKAEGRAEGRAEGLEEGVEKGREEGMKAMVLDNLEDGKTQAQIESRLMRHFDVDAKRAHEIFCKYSHTSSSDDIK